MRTFEEILRDSAVDKACEEIGVDFKRTFLSLSGEDYEGYVWCPYPHSAVGLQGGLVIHAIPPIGSDKMWEEWFTMDSKRIHVLLHTAPFDGASDTVDIAPDDADHPLRVRGEKWYLKQEVLTDC